MTQNNLEFLEQLYLKLSQFILGDNELVTLKNTINELKNNAYKSKKDIVITKYMEIKDLIYNYQFRKEVNEEKDILEIINYFEYFMNKYSFPKLISVFGCPAQIKDRFTLSLYNLFKISDESNISSLDKIFVNVPLIQENLFRVAHLDKIIRGQRLNLLFIPELDYFPKIKKDSNEECITRILIKILNQFLLLNSTLIIVLKGEGYLHDNEQKLFELFSSYDLDNIGQLVYDKILFINCISNFYNEKTEINMTYRQGKFPNFTLSLNESLELQGTNFLCVKDYIIEKGTNESTNSAFSPFLQMQLESITKRQMKRPKAYGLFDLVKSNCLYNIYSDNKKEIIIVIETPGDYGNDNFKSRLEYIESFPDSFVYIYIELYNKKYIINEKIKFEVIGSNREITKIDSEFKKSISHYKGLTTMSFILNIHR